MAEYPVSTGRPSVARVSAIIHAIGLPFLVFIAIASALGWSDLYRWTADAQTLTLARPWDGAISHLGMIAWSSASAIGIFVALTRWRQADPELTRLLLVGGLVTAVLLVDDLFMVHDELLPEEFGIPELLATGGVALVPLAYVVVFRRPILRRTPWQVLAIAVAYLAVMGAVDAVEHDIAIPAHHLWEEGAKFLGLLHWCGYMVLLTWIVLESRTSTRETAGQGPTALTTSLGPAS